MTTSEIDAEQIPFIDYWSAVDAAMLRLYGIDTADAGIEPDLLAEAQDAGDSPDAFARWFGTKHDLDEIPPV